MTTSFSESGKRIRSLGTDIFAAIFESTARYVAISIIHGEIGSSPLEVLDWRLSTSRQGEIKSSKLAISSSGSTRRREYSTPQDPRCRINNNANEIRVCCQSRASIARVSTELIAEASRCGGLSVWMFLKMPTILP
ncbi:hypothetical protein PC119_g21207 [Phytophthora cactorum]|uniref:Uncharacterized protein n=1 Tax=Phytophthora cactorum TaxID=29920 RepID=A0A8T1BLM3_9STRA|nr:hypothetical protein PC111_g18956 [Phytophthora cactorum]KAG2881527.1 hypothetical protein PC114_g21507 [Phytophthora cactorum]KAG2903000.1 hypothetical protein PC117_g21344 [Phytophthora cactorum]KAG2980673.1 hypothetical protein PC119_g21207 [Phytophthora cactorum]KAG3061324.1 hypothetical protein PC122_g19687 [Phytophthora cactorum]